MNNKIGDIIKVNITTIVDFGAFVSFDGLSGLIHYKEIPKGKHGNINTILKIGDIVDAKILEIKPGNKYGLSIRSKK